MHSDAALTALRDIAHHMDLATRFAAALAQQVWDTVQIDLPPLRTVIDQELAASRG